MHGARRHSRQICVEEAKGFKHNGDLYVRLPNFLYRKMIVHENTVDTYCIILFPSTRFRFQSEESFWIIFCFPWVAFLFVPNFF